MAGKNTGALCKTADDALQYRMAASRLMPPSGLQRAQQHVDGEPPPLLSGLFRGFVRAIGCAVMKWSPYAHATLLIINANFIAPVETRRHHFGSLTKNLHAQYQAPVGLHDRVCWILQFPPRSRGPMLRPLGFACAMPLHAARGHMGMM